MKKSETEKMKTLEVKATSDNRKELFMLMQKHPELPIIPFVDGEIVAGDNFARWMGAWGSASVDEYLFPRNELDPVIFRSDDDVFDTLEKFLSIEEFDKLPESEDECRRVYDALPWKKAIIVNIDLPE